MSLIGEWFGRDSDFALYLRVVTCEKLSTLDGEKDALAAFKALPQIRGPLSVILSFD